MGEVFEAYDERLDRRVALKLIRPSRARDDAARERFRREAQATARLNHPNIVQVFDILQTDEADCIIMELVNGRPLAERLRSGPLEVAEALVVALEIAGALAEAHELGIVHRDLKSENVLITTAGRAKVLDFGIAKNVGSGAPGLTATGVILGTCRAMSPEQAEGGVIDARSDLFSFGTLLYEMVTGRSPFATGNDISTLFRIRHYRHTPACEANPQVPEALSALIDRLLEKDRERRPRSAREVGEVIEKIQLRWTDRPSGRRSGPAAVSRGTAATEVTLVYNHPAFSSTGERRQVTLMRCGLVLASGGSPDPEDLLASMAWLQGAAAEVAQRYEGTLGPATPDGVQILFGYPLAHEDDARRAVHAALLLRARAASGQTDGLALRVGIHTGPMVVAWTEPSMQEGLTLGETASLAAAVQSLAEPGAILLSSATHRLAGPFFTCEALAPVHLPSLQKPVAAHRVVADRDVEDRIDSGTGEALTPLVARDRELALLLERWSLAKEGKGQVAMVAGEAGIGKSRLVHELRQRIAAEGPAQLDCRCSPYYSNTALHPMTEMLRRLLHSSREAQPAEQLGRLEEMIGRYDLPPAETVPLLAALLGLPAGERYAPLNLSPERQRVKTLNALVALLAAVAERQPLLLVVEDLHWMDPTTLELLSSLFQQVPAMRMLGLLTYRPDFVAPWPSRSYLAHLHLEPLTPEQVQRMAEHLTVGHPLPAPLLEQMAAKTDGVPLVVEEMVKMVLESFQDESEPDVSLRPLEIPATLRDSLTARLDRLGMAKEVAQLASVLGREFPYELLSAVSPWDGTVLQQHLNRLVEAELLYRRGMPPKTSYLFKHALIQEAAYASMLKSARQRQHRRTAEVLAERFPEITKRHPELLAHHYSEAGLKEQAIAAWKRAGEEAILSSANREAVGHFHRALDLLAAMPETTERHREEIAVQVGLGVALFSVESPASPQIERAFVRARDLCARVESAPQLPAVLRGQHAFELCSGQYDRAHDTAVELLELARRLGDPMLLLIGYQGVGFALLMQGELAAARAQLEQGIACLDAERSAAAVLTPGGGHPAVECITCLAWALWFLGFPDAALQRSDEALALARGHPRAHSFALLMAGRVHAFRGEIDKVREMVQEFDAVTVEYGMPGVRPAGMVMHGWVLVEQGEEEEGIAELTRNLGILRQVGELIWMPQNLAWLAEAHARAGRLPEALALLGDALAAAASGCQRLADAELHRLRAGLLALQGAPAGEIEGELHRALEIARRQQSKSFELRAAASLARLWAAHGRRSDGRDLLAGVYGWFTEGFETGDLRDARALLDELS